MDLYAQNTKLTGIDKETLRRMEDSYMKLLSAAKSNEHPSLAAFKAHASKSVAAAEKGRITLSQDSTGEIVFSKQLPGDNAPSGFRGLTMPSGHGSVWRFSGPVSNLLGTDFVPSQDKQLHFVFVEGQGLVYMFGEGSVKQKSGKVLKFPIKRHALLDKPEKGKAGMKPKEYLARLDFFVQQNDVSGIDPQQMQDIENSYFEHVSSNKSRLRFAITSLTPYASDQLPKAMRGRVSVREDEKGDLRFEKDLPNDDIPVGIRGATVPLGHGSVLRFRGKVTNFGGAEFNSNPNDPLRFAFVKDKGLVYLFGSGTITRHDGKSITLPLNSLAIFEKKAAPKPVTVAKAPEKKHVPQVAKKSRSLFKKERKVKKEKKIATPKKVARKSVDKKSLGAPLAEANTKSHSKNGKSKFRAPSKSSSVEIQLVSGTIFHGKVLNATETAIVIDEQGSPRTVSVADIKSVKRHRKKRSFPQFAFANKKTKPTKTDSKAPKAKAVTKSDKKDREIVQKDPKEEKAAAPKAAATKTSSKDEADQKKPSKEKAKVASSQKSKPTAPTVVAQSEAPRKSKGEIPDTERIKKPTNVPQAAMKSMATSASKSKMVASVKKEEPSAKTEKATLAQPAKKESRTGCHKVW